MLQYIFTKRNAPRWIILFIDLGISFTSLIIAYYLRFNFILPNELIDSNEFNSLYWVVPLVLSVRLMSFLISKTYTGIIRYTGTKDAGKIFIVILSGSIIIGISNLISYRINQSYLIPFSVIGIDFLANIFIMTFSRLMVKNLYAEYIGVFDEKDKENVLILGINDMALITKKTLTNDINSKYRIEAFIDYTGVHKGQKLDGISVYGINMLETLIEKYEISSIIFSEKNIPSKIKDKLIETCLNNNIKVLTLPDVSTWINGELSVKQIRKVKIDDLLERDPIKLDEAQIKRDTLNRTILVTGAAGSIGSEIVRQLIRFNPKHIIVFDQAESPLYDLELELKEQFRFSKISVVIGSIADKNRMESVFEKYKPSLIYHAAAYKHVPMMENNPSEAIRINVAGTKTLADLAVKYEVRKFVMISTDKAVRPTNVMGASKRIAEIYTQSLNAFDGTKFITTRFGNVLGSNGSVILRFKKQIQKGGPVTVTHPEITRYFMTIPEACQLVLEAGAMGKGGEIFVFDMGKSVKIIDLAKKMIKLSGLELGIDINISITGLRPGEKLYEELLNDKENTLPTHHPQIMIGKVIAYNHFEIKTAINKLINTATTQDHFKIVKQMKEIVPDFVSKNSIYEKLDLEKPQEAVKRNGNKVKGIVGSRYLTGDKRTLAN